MGFASSAKSPQIYEIPCANPCGFLYVGASGTLRLCTSVTHVTIPGHVDVKACPKAPGRSLAKPKPISLGPQNPKQPPNWAAVKELNSSYHILDI